MKCLKAKLILSLIILSFSGIMAQPFSGGFFAGFSASQVDGDTYYGFDKPGITAGAYIGNEIGRSGNFNWRAELRYTQKGAYRKQLETDPFMYRLSLHYVEFPFMLQYEAIDKVFVEGGLSPDIYLFHSEENQDGEFRPEDYPAFHRFGLGGNIGGIYAFGERLRGGVRWTYSLIPIREHASGQTYLLNRGQYSNVLTFSLYYHFR